MFYTFLAIFAATAIVTLLGILCIVPIEQENLRWLLGAFLIELAGAVVALFRGAPFFTARGDVVSSMARSVAVIDELTPQLEAVAAGETQAQVHRHYGIVVRKEGNDLVAYQKLHVISGDDLAKLSSEQQEVIHTYESSMERFRERWKKPYDERADATDQERRKIDRELGSLVRERKQDLFRILDFLIQRGMVLRDHYERIRGIVDSIAAKT